MLHYNRKHVFFALIFLFVCCTACGTKNASSIRLARTEGSVKINDNKGRDLSPSEGLKLYNNYEIQTESAAYAWMDLDSSKTAKMDSESQVLIQEEGKHLDIVVNQGSLFFNIENSLKEDETLNIHTSSMMVGIRGTCGWVAIENPEHMKVYLLEGTVICRIQDADTDINDISISAWQMADMQLKNGEGSITIYEFSPLDIPDFVKEEIEEISQNPEAAQSDEAGVSAVLTMPVTAQEIQELWNSGTKNITILPSEGDNVLTIDTNFEDSSGNYAFEEDYGLLSYPDCTLTLKEGVDLMVDDEVTFSSGGNFVAEGNVTIRGLLSASGSTTISGVIRILPSEGHTDMPDSSDNYGQLMAGGNFTATQEIISECYFAPIQNVVADALICGEHGCFFNAGDLTGNITFDTGSSLSSSLSDTVHGTVTVNRGTVYLGGDVDHIVINGGEAYINAGEVPLITDSLTINGGTVYLMKILPETSLGSVSVNGGELIDYSEEMGEEISDTPL